MATLKNSNQREYDSWRGMHYRCKEGPGTKSYPGYKARGITVCARWATFENFFADMGKKPSKLHTIDRIDNDKGYSPENCRWATPREQNLNTRATVTVTVRGVTFPTLKDAKKAMKIAHETIISYAEKGVPGFSLKRKYPKGAIQ